MAVISLQPAKFLEKANVADIYGGMLGTSDASILSVQTCQKPRRNRAN